MWAQGPNDLVHLLLLFQAMAESWIEVEQAELELVPMWMPALQVAVIPTMPERWPQQSFSIIFFQ